MTRIKLDLPAQFQFSTELTVRVTDVNYGNHLGNDALLGLIHEARVRFLASMGYTEKEVEGVGILMSDCAIIYKSQGYLGDELSIDVTVVEFSRVGCDLFYLVMKADGSELARAKTGIVFFDYARKVICPVPEEFGTRFRDQPGLRP